MLRVALLALALLVATLFAAVPRSQAAEPAWGLSTDRGYAQDTVTASGSGWNPDADVFGYTDDTLQTLLFQTVTDSKGGFQGYQFILPDLDPNDYRFFACQDCAHVVGAYFPFSVDPPTSSGTFFLDTSTGRPGDTLTASGTGWSPDTDVFGYTDNTLQTRLFQTVTDSNGSFQGYQFLLPNLDPNTYQFFACQDCARRIGAQSSFTVEKPAASASLILDTSTGRPGDTVTASGTGWSPDADVFGYSDSTLQTLLFQTVTDSNGSFQGYRFILPNLDPNTYQFYACQVCTNLVGTSASFTVNTPASAATLVLDTSTGQPGDTVTASGTGWNPNTDLFGYSDNTLQTLLFQTVTDSNGSFQGYRFTVPNLTPNDYQFFACQDCAHHIGASSRFTFLPEAGQQSRSLLPFVAWPLAILVLLAAGAIAARHRRTRRAGLRKPRFEPRPDTSFNVEPSQGDALTLPSLRLVPRDDDSDTAGQVEVRG